MDRQIVNSSRWRLGAALLATALAATACWSAPSSRGAAAGQGQPATATGDPVSGGTLDVALELAPGCADPGTPSVVPAITRNIVDSLVDIDPDTGKAVPWLAKSWKINDGATSFTFTLRDGVTFSDGSPLTADVVKKNFDRLIELGAHVPSAASKLSGYGGTTVHNDHSFTVKFDEPRADFMQAAASRALGILAPATLPHSAQQRCQGKLIGSGPFVLKSYMPSQGAVLVRRDGYNWGSAALDNRGEAYLEKITFKVVPEASVRAGLLESGQTDIIDVEPHNIPRFSQGETYVAVGRQGGTPTTLDMNQKDPILRQEAVRRAIMLGIDRQEVVDTLLTSRHRVATGVLTSVQAGYLDLSADVKHAPEEARNLLKQAGWVAGPDGIRERHGQRLAVDVITRGKVPILELIQQQLAGIGVELKIRMLTPANYEQVQSSGDFGMEFTQHARPDPALLHTLYSSKDINIYNVPPSELDQILDDVLSKADPAARQAAVAAAQRYLVRHAYTAPIWEGLQLHAVSRGVQNVVYDTETTHRYAGIWLSQ